LAEADPKNLEATSTCRPEQQGQKAETLHMSAVRDLVDLDAPPPPPAPEDAPAGSLPGPLPGRRRRFSNEEKRQFLREAMGESESMSSVGRRYGLSVSLLFRWRRQLDGTTAPAKKREDDTRAEVRDLRDRVRELERLLGRKTLESELLKQELSRLGHNPSLALTALDSAQQGRG
jgi:transposase